MSQLTVDHFVLPNWTSDHAVFVIQWRHLVIHVFAFIAMTVVGTLSHEGGHWIAARVMGVDAWINYAATFYDHNVTMSNEQRLWFTLGGPLQTILTGTIGLLLAYRIPRHTDHLSGHQWAAVYAALFWLRQPANMFVGVLITLTGGNVGYRSDEPKISLALGIHPFAITVVTGLIGSLVLAFIVFRVIPRQQRLTFLVSGLVGGVAGYILWLHIVGPVLMP